MLITDEGLARLQTVMDHITQHPEEHEQSWWGEQVDCGTTACIAGHLVIRFAQPVWAAGSLVSAVVTPGLGTREVSVWRAAVFLLVGHDNPHLWPNREVDALFFSPSREPGKLWTLADRLAEERLTIPAQFQQEAAK